MALTSHSGVKRIYLSIIGGKLAQKVEKGTANAVSRLNKKSEEVWELLHQKVSGMIEEMKIEKKDFGEQLDITMNDVGERYTISIPVESKWFDSFCAKIGSAQLDKTLEIVPYSFEAKDGSGKKNGINIYQKGNPAADEKGKLPYYFSKENAMGKPFPPDQKLGDREYKMFKLQEREFYCKYINNMAFNPAKTSDLPF